MRAYTDHLLNWLANARLSRHLLEVVFRARARRQLGRLDQPPERAQLRTLQGLLHQAQKTRFGREHDFRRIRTAADFRRLVPLTTPVELASACWPVDLRQLHGTTWPTLLLPEGGEALPTSPALHAAHRAALRTALGLALHARPRARLLAGQIVQVGEEAGPARPERIPYVLRPFAHTSAVPDDALRDLAGRHAHDNVTCLTGSPERLGPFLEHVKQVRGEERLDRIWPKLIGVFCSRSAAGPSLDGLRRAVGNEPVVLEMLARPEGPIALEDPRPDAPGGLRLLIDCGTYFEFVPAKATGPDAPRLGLEDVKPEVEYDLAITSPAGLWACRIGLTVCFTSLQPPVLRVVGPAPVCPLIPAAEAPRADAPSSAPPPRAIHRQSADIPGGPPRSFVHSPWSIPVDRG